MSEKKKLRLTVIDVVIILFILACIVGALIKSGVTAKIFYGDEAASTVVYTVKIEENADKYLERVLTVGTELVDADTKTKLGSITEVANKPYVSEIYDGADSMLSYVDSSKLWLYITVTGSGRADEHGYILDGGIIVAPGLEVNAESRLARATGIIVSASAETEGK